MDNKKNILTYAGLNSVLLLIKRNKNFREHAAWLAAFPSARPA